MSSFGRKTWTPLKIALTLAASIALSVVVFAGWQYWLFKGGIFRTSSFDEVKWKSLGKVTNDFSCYRGGMAKDIRTNILRIGLTMAEVEEVLGEPNLNEAGSYEYNLGMCSGLRIDLDTLNVYFNSAGKLTKSGVVQH